MPVPPGTGIDLGRTARPAVRLGPVRNSWETVMALVLHKFGVGERVELSPSRTDGNTPAGTYTIVRQLPDETNDRHYRVKNARDGHERVVRESQLGRLIGARAR